MKTLKLGPLLVLVGSFPVARVLIERGVNLVKSASANCAGFFLSIRNIIFGTLKIGKNNPDIANSEFESHGFLENIWHIWLHGREMAMDWI